MITNQFDTLTIRRDAFQASHTQLNPTAWSVRKDPSLLMDQQWSESDGIKRKYHSLIKFQLMMSINKLNFVYYVFVIIIPVILVAWFLP
jgi:hypothetical protein